MKRKNMARNALFTSVLSLLLCVSMLVGTTFAWFTDEVTSSNNIIKSGNLDVEMYWADGTEAVPDDDSDEWKDASTGAIFNYDLWEPGYTEVRHIKISNEGTLALKYQLMIKANGTVSDLADVIDVYFIDPATQVAARTDLANAKKVGTLREVLAGMPQNASGSLVAGKSATVTLALKMQESAGNEYQNLAIGTDFSVVLVATQYSSESDSFGKDYDIQAGLPGVSENTVPSGSATAVNGEVRAEDGSKIATYEIPKTAIAPDAETVKVNVKKTETNPNITVAADSEAQTFDVNVTGLKENNDVPVKVQLRIPAGLNPDTVKLYHYDDEITCSYNPTTGYVTFESATFSPFTVVYDAESEYEPPVVGPETELPKATVTLYTDTENIEWGNYGQWSPTAGLEAKLDVAYKFSCPAELDEKFAYWYCDFYVKLDQDLGENEIFLGGNYGSFGWVGFHNGDMTLPANEEIPLLGSVTSNPWTYEDVYDFVGEFICGVGDVNDALAGATFTVMLRLTNPENAEEYYNIETIKYTFPIPKTVTTAGELDTALAAGGKVKLGADIDMGSEKLTVASDVALDLNGYVLSGTCNANQGHLIMVNNGAALDIKDSSSAKTGKITYAMGSSDTGWAIDLEGELNLYGGTIELTGEPWSIGYAVDVRPNAWGSNYTEDTVFHMYGGKVLSSDGAIRVASSSADTYTNIVASFIMDGGEINAIWDGIFVQQSDAAYDTLKVTINGGTITSKLSPIRIYGPAPTSVNAGTAKPMTIAINGGSLNVAGTPDETRVWYALGKIMLGGGMTQEVLNQYATITCA